MNAKNVLNTETTEASDLLPTHQFTQLLKLMASVGNSKNSSKETGLVIVFMSTLSFFGVILSLFVLLVVLKVSVCPAQFLEPGAPQKTNTIS
jgi:hypothetical protein